MDDPVDQGVPDMGAHRRSQNAVDDVTRHLVVFGIAGEVDQEQRKDFLDNVLFITEPVSVERQPDPKVTALVPQLEDAVDIAREIAHRNRIAVPPQPPGQDGAQPFQHHRTVGAAVRRVVNRVGHDVNCDPGPASPTRVRRTRSRGAAGSSPKFQIW